MNGRNTLLAILALLTLTATPLVAEGQVSARVPRIGFLSVGSPSDNPQFREAFLQGLRDLGYIEGGNIAIEWRYAERRTERLPELAENLVQLKVDVIVAETPPTPNAAKQATSTIPIVFAISGDPVGDGLVTSLARPGGNATGLTTISAAVVGKQLEMLRSVVPKLSRVAVLHNPGNPAHPNVLRHVQDAAHDLGLQVELMPASSASEINAAFAAMRRKRVGGVLVLRDVLFLAQRTQVAALAAKGHLPAIYGVREHAVAGGLMAYGANAPGMFQRAANYVDKILKGTKPADLPVEQPTKFDMVINANSARKLGITIPQSVLLLASEVIH